MARLVLFLMLLAVAALALAAVVTLVRTLAAPAPARPLAAQEDTMPRAVRTVSYVLLLMLLLGVTSGWLGPSP